MRLVDNDQIDIWPLAPGKRPDRGDLDRLVAIRSFMNALHYAERVNAFSLESADALVDKRQGRHYESNSPALGERALNNVAR